MTLKKTVKTIAATLLAYPVFLAVGVVTSIAIAFLMEIPILGTLLYWPADTSWAMVVVPAVFSMGAAAFVSMKLSNTYKPILRLIQFFYLLDILFMLFYDGIIWDKLSTDLLILVTGFFFLTEYPAKQKEKETPALQNTSQQTTVPLTGTDDTSAAPSACNREEQIQEWLPALIRQASVDQIPFFQKAFLLQSLEAPDDADDQRLAQNAARIYQDYYKDVAEQVSESVFRYNPSLKTSCVPFTAFLENRNPTAGTLYTFFYKRLTDPEGPSEPDLAAELDQMQRRLLRKALTELLDDAEPVSRS